MDFNPESPFTSLRRNFIYCAKRLTGVAPTIDDIQTIDAGLYKAEREQGGNTWCVYHLPPPQRPDVIAAAHLAGMFGSAMVSAVSLPRPVQGGMGLDLPAALDLLHAFGGNAVCFGSSPSYYKNVAQLTGHEFKTVPQAFAPAL